MVAFKIQLEESFVQTIGYGEIATQLPALVQKAVLKLAAQDVLKDLSGVDLENDKEWQLARELAWQQEKPKCFFQHE